jgi:hypothetical protein
LSDEYTVNRGHECQDHFSFAFAAGTGGSETSDNVPTVLRPHL